MQHEQYFTPEIERSLISAAQSGDRESRDRLVLGCLPFVRKSLQRRYPTIDDQDFEDLVHDAVPALIDCITRYDLNHPSRARLYVFARSEIHNSVVRFYRHQKLLSYRDDLPELISPDDPEARTVADQSISLVRSALRSLSAEDQQVLFDRHGCDQPASRRELADRYDCPQHVIQYAEQRAMDRFLAAFPSRLNPTHSYPVH